MKIKPYHLHKYNQAQFLNTFTKVEQRVKILTYEHFLEKYFKNNKYTYKEMTEKQEVLKRVYYKYMHIMPKDNRHSLGKKYNEALYNSIPEKTKEHAAVFNINLTREHFIYVQNYSTIEILNIVRNVKCNNLEIDSSDLKSLIAKYYNGKEDFFIKLAASELSFIYFYEIFGKVWDQIADILGIENPRQIVQLLNGVNRDRIYETVTLSQETINLIVDLVCDNTIWMDSSPSKTLTNMFKYISMTYEQKKKLIFAKANKCTSIIAGNVTLESYNLPFKSILTSEDYNTLINEVIFIGDNSIKINLGNSNE